MSQVQTEARRHLRTGDAHLKIARAYREHGMEEDARVAEAAATECWDRADEIQPGVSGR
ncbi:MAG: hypothetical protein ACLFWG_00280 [Longimicrobiales bacterium]